MNLKSIIHWLAKRRKLNLLFIGLYFALILVMHDPLVKLSVWIVAGLSLGVYDTVVAVIVVLIVFLSIWGFAKNVRKYRHNIALQVLIGLGTLTFLFVHSRILSVMNIEAIHFVQFMLLALLLFPLFRRILPTLLIALLFAFLDELFQYLILYPERENYLDFNDVVMDLLGMGMGMLFLLNADILWKPIGKFWRSPVFYIWTLILIVVALSLSMGWFALYNTGPSDALFFFNEGPPNMPFWAEFWNSGIYYHVLSPSEGMVIIAALLGFYGLGDWLRRSPATQ